MVLRSDGGRADRSPCDARAGMDMQEDGALVPGRARRVTGGPHKTQGRDIPGPTALNSSRHPALNCVILCRGLDSRSPIYRVQVLRERHGFGVVAE